MPVNWPTMMPGECSGCGAVLGGDQWVSGDCVQAPLTTMAWLDCWRCPCGLSTEMVTLIATGNERLLADGPAGDVYWGDVADLDEAGQPSAWFDVHRGDGARWCVERYVFADFHGVGATVFDVHRHVAPVLAADTTGSAWAVEISSKAITLCRAAAEEL
ncbi:MAG: hypothetical protein ABMA25_02525 [Ilumatobacteraceae bacterium]